MNIFIRAFFVLVLSILIVSGCSEPWEPVYEVGQQCELSGVNVTIMKLANSRSEPKSYYVVFPSVDGRWIEERVLTGAGCGMEDSTNV